MRNECWVRFNRIERQAEIDNNAASQCLDLKTRLKGREIEAKCEPVRSFAMNQNRPTRGSLEVRTASISTLIYSFEARLNLPNSSHILLNLCSVHDQMSSLATALCPKASEVKS